MWRITTVKCEEQSQNFMLTLLKINLGFVVFFIFFTGHTNILSHIFYLCWSNLQTAFLKLQGDSEAVVNNCHFD